MKKWMAIVVGLIVVLGVIGTNTYLLLEEQMVELEDLDIVMAEEVDMYESITASGIVEPRSDQRVYEEPQHGEVEEIEVDEGETVEEGDLLVSYEEDEDMERQMISTENRIDRLHLEAEQQNEQILNAETRIANAENNQESDEVIEQHEQERDDLLFQQQLTEQEIQEEEEELAYYQAQHDDAYQVHSNVSGIVHERNEPAEAFEGESLLHIVSDEDWDINGIVSEYDLVHLQEDHEVTVEANVLNDREWSGTIVELGTTPADEEDPLETEEENVASYPFTVQLEEDAPELEYGFHVNVFIDVETATDATVIPAEVIETETSAEEEADIKYVYLIEDGIIVKQGVETGISNEQGVQILAGIEDGDRIVSQNEEDPVMSGMEVDQDDSTQ
ncbi:HlyD family efflux transporter periplasmic adaptor subunit [Salicibibacter cibarius]|uniref:HlyD family efflux transporter periplasmic adaptor subunit n=1 Tax=Salicibibacter cibarius TaxID=2743000 RepID=A0A7T6Z418_9BACI|nr:HlyD family efflux transporter periplasmic adaptor subunit [Salicibibacter cibarius]QQK76509.1 HlyD family efflux transporter periplasmic adaptor subunit [Salicibibacter cibarius]